MTPSERTYYENPSLWAPENYEGDQGERSQQTIRWIPEGTLTVLDAGCGNGALTNLLGHLPTVIGMDRSLAALEWVQQDKCQADIAALPFGNNAFDLLISTEVLEHLPAPLFTQALDEIARVAKQHVLISVPYRENLDIRMVICPQCSFSFHRYYHMRSFARRDLEQLFSPKHGLTLCKTSGIVSESISGATLATQLRATILQRLGRRKTEFGASTICPECAYTLNEQKNDDSDVSPPDPTTRPAATRSKAYRVADIIIPQKNTYRWWLALYQKS